MILGFTGNRTGLTFAQHRALRALLYRLAPTVAHHGCCLGADEEFASMIRADHRRCRVVAHPSTSARMTSATATTRSHEGRPLLPPLERNKVIVTESEALVACPGTATEQRRSGTWATIREARRQGKRVHLVLPDGSVQEETNG